MTHQSEARTEVFEPRSKGRGRHFEDSEMTHSVPSTAAIGGHPIHPMLIPFPIAFLTAAAGTDLAYSRTSDPFWARASIWLLRAGLASGAAAAVFGATDFSTISRSRSSGTGWLHAIGNGLALALTAANLAQRRDDQGDGIQPNGLAMSVAVAGLLGVTGWAGGELSYRHGIGVSGHDGRESMRIEPPREW